MKDCLKPHRDLEAEAQLKAKIRRIEDLLSGSEDRAAIEETLREAARLVKTPNRVLNLTVIEEYESWTDLDGLVGELTMEIPVLPEFSKEDFISVVEWIREIIENDRPSEEVPLDYWMSFYREFFVLNFPGTAGDDLFDEIFEDTSLEELVKMAFPDTE